MTRAPTVESNGEFVEVVVQMLAADRSVNGACVSWKIVPAMMDVCRPHAAHCNSRFRTSHDFPFPHRGQRKPSGHRSFTR
jgi:hypothetical protein